jgi:exonuclease III
LIIIITLNLNGLNSPIKKKNHRLADWIKKTRPNHLNLQETLAKTNVGLK